MAQVKDGQLDQLNGLFDRYSKRIFGYFLKSTLQRDDSDDLTQDLFIRVMKYRKSYREGQRFEYWIFQIARNMLKDHFRKLKLSADHFDPSQVMADVPEENSNELDERERMLYLAMNKLSSDKRELLVMSKFNGLKYEQIAEIRKTSVSNIKVQVHRIIMELKDIYFEEYEQENEHIR
jgi:RNA polymerase sigma-70 factor (ECF subfamily)